MATTGAIVYSTSTPSGAEMFGRGILLVAFLLLFGLSLVGIYYSFRNKAWIGLFVSLFALALAINGFRLGWKLWHAEGKEEGKEDPLITILKGENIGEAIFNWTTFIAIILMGLVVVVISFGR